MLVEFLLEKAFRVGTIQSRGTFACLIYDYLVFERKFMVTTFECQWILFWELVILLSTLLMKSLQVIQPLLCSSIFETVELRPRCQRYPGSYWMITSSLNLIQLTQGLSLIVSGRLCFSVRGNQKLHFIFFSTAILWQWFGVGCYGCQVWHR